MISLALLASLALAEDAPPPAAPEPPAEAPPAPETPAAPEASPPPAPEPPSPSEPLGIGAGEPGPGLAGTAPPVDDAVARLKAAAVPHVHRWTFGKGDAAFVETWGHLREIGSKLPDPVVDADGTRTGQTWLLDQRLRAGLALGGAGVRVATEWDLLTGNLAGQPWSLGEIDARMRDEIGTPGTLDGQTPRRASMSFVSAGEVPFLQVNVGLMPAHTWGLGILANGGEKDTIFGRVDRGDRMLRVQTTLAPIAKGDARLPLFFTFAFDRVVEDELARWSDGQAAYQVISSVLYVDPATRGRYGLFYTYRTQTEPTDAPRPTDAHVIDGYVDQPVDLGEAGWRMRIAAEGAAIVGETARVLTYADDTSTRIRSGGGALELSVDTPERWATLHVRGGAASATGDPDAGKLQDFTFDGNYNVGMVLFDELEGAVEARVWQQVGDPEHTGRRPYGADLLATEGSVRRAAWINPIVEGRPLSWLTVAGGYVAAWATGPIAQPYYTTRAGGEPRNHLDQPTAGKHLLGHELDLALTLGGPATNAWKLRPSLKLESGLGWPGAAMGGGMLWVGRATARFDW